MVSGTHAKNGMLVEQYHICQQQQVARISLDSWLRAAYFNAINCREIYQQNMKVNIKFYFVDKEHSASIVDTHHLIMLSCYAYMCHTTYLLNLNVN